MNSPTLSSFLTIFPELECSVESEAAFLFWLSEAECLAEALGVDQDARKVFLALAHILALKDQPNGPVASVTHVNSSITYQSSKVEGDGIYALRWTSYGKILADCISLGADINTCFCWTSLECC